MNIKIHRFIIINLAEQNVGIKSVNTYLMVSRLWVETNNPILFEPEECPVCWGDMWTRVTLSCGHEFHLECIGAWFLRQENCPYCRHPFSCPPAPQSEEEAPQSEDEEEEQRNVQCANLCGLCFGHRTTLQSQSRRRRRSSTY